MFKLYAKKALVLLLPLVLLLSFSPSFLVKSSTNLPQNSGSTYTDLQTQLNDNLKKQGDLQGRIKSAQSQEKSLSSQIEIMNDQITLTGLQIDETENRIAQLSLDIVNTENKLDDLQTDLDHKTDVANNRIRSVYEEGERKGIELFLQSASFNDFLVTQKYTQAIHDQDIKMITSLQELKDTYLAQKNLLADQHKSAQDLKTQLDQQKTDLDSQKNQKSTLLALTKNNEQVYQQQLAQIKLDQQAIQAALLNLGTKLGPVSRGDIIAFQGNTGCSTGTHLHFGYIINNKVVNPAPYLSNGTLAWPEKDPHITQPFGANANNGLYGPQGHPAIDMQSSPYPGYGQPIRAAKSGTAYLSSDDGCPSIIPGTGKGWGITIDHGDGTKTIYWHIQH